MSDRPLLRPFSPGTAVDFNDDRRGADDNSGEQNGATTIRAVPSVFLSFGPTMWMRVQTAQVTG